MSPKFLIILFTFLWSMKSHAACSILDSNENPISHLNDPIGHLLLSSKICPTNVFQFRNIILQQNLKLETTLVANRGFHNPVEGSFSLFEMAKGVSTLGDSVESGDFFFGHFTGVNNKILIANQSPIKDSLMIEALAWDASKGYYNFYELRGTGSDGQWFYRGDSADIFHDNTFIHRQPNPAKPQFGVGKNMRCSACHLSGGPLMKELSEPHNDWWEPIRKLNFGGRIPDANLYFILETLVPASSLAKSVLDGLNKLESSPSFQKIKTQLTLQEQLRPLFCAMEVNFQSDLLSHQNTTAAIQVPLEFFVDERLISLEKRKQLQATLIVDRAKYIDVLQKLGSRFPIDKKSSHTLKDITTLDADHAWLTPVKAQSDKNAISVLIEKGLIDSHFVLSVLAIDFTNPIMSSTRCNLLQFVPNEFYQNWKQIFIQNLSYSNTLPAKELVQNLTHPSYNEAFYDKKIESYLSNCASELKDSGHILKYVKLLNQRRNEIRESEISKNPRGQILEPGFRVIFPEFLNYTGEINFNDISHR